MGGGTSDAAWDAVIKGAMETLWSCMDTLKVKLHAGGVLVAQFQPNQGDTRMGNTPTRWSPIQRATEFTFSGNASTLVRLGQYAY